MLPSGFTSKIKSIDTFDGPVDEAFAPMSVTIQLEDDIDISRGDMIVRPNNQPKAEQDIDIMVCWMSEKPLIPKGKYVDLDDFSKKASSEEMAGLLKGINIVARKLQISGDNGKGYRALSNISEHGGQEVPHLHFHLFGGEKVGKMVE